MLEVGERVPEFELPDQDGRQVRSGELHAGGPVVLYFYPKDETPGCTVEACGFRDAYHEFGDAGARVVGVSGDSVESHQAFARRHRLPFTLLADREGTLRAALGVPKVLGLWDGRVTFVIDSKGVVRHRFSSQLQWRKHVDEALRVVKQLAASGT